MVLSDTTRPTVIFPEGQSISPSRVTKRMFGSAEAAVHGGEAGEGFLQFPHADAGAADEEDGFFGMGIFGVPPLLAVVKSPSHDNQIV